MNSHGVIESRSLVLYGDREGRLSFLGNLDTADHTEEKAKVINAAWRTELLQFLTVLAILHLDDLKKRMICTRMI